MGSDLLNLKKRRRRLENGNERASGSEIVGGHSHRHHIRSRGGLGQGSELGPLQAGLDFRGDARAPDYAPYRSNLSVPPFKHPDS